jgi:hypothetical protein
MIKEIIREIKESKSIKFKNGLIKLTDEEFEVKNCEDVILDYDGCAKNDGIADFEKEDEEYILAFVTCIDGKANTPVVIDMNTCEVKAKGIKEIKTKFGIDVKEIVKKYNEKGKSISL